MPAEPLKGVDALEVVEQPVTHEGLVPVTTPPAEDTEAREQIKLIMTLLAKRMGDVDELRVEIAELNNKLQIAFTQMGHGKTWSSLSPAQRAVVLVDDDTDRDNITEELVQEVLTLTKGNEA